MAGISKEFVESLQTELKESKKQLHTLRKVQGNLGSVSNDLDQLKSENEELKQANKQLGKSGAVAGGKAPVFDISQKLGEGTPGLIFTTQLTEKDYDLHYAYKSGNSATVTEYVVKYRDGKFHDTMIG